MSSFMGGTARQATIVGGGFDFGQRDKMDKSNQRAIERLRRLRNKIDRAIDFFEGSPKASFRPNADPLPPQIMMLGEFLIVEIEPAGRAFDLRDELNQLRDAAATNEG